MVSAAWPLLLIKGYHSKCLCLEEQGPLNSLGTFHYAKISGNLGLNVNGTVRPRWKFSGPIENCRSIFRNFRFQSRSSSSLHTVVKMADGSDVVVYPTVQCVQASDARPKLSPYAQLHTRLRYSSAS